MDDGTAEALRLRLAAVARKWLEDPRADYAGNITDKAGVKGHALNSLVLAGARISLSEHGRVVCSFQVPPPLTDSDGTWHAGALAAAVDNMCSAVVFTVVGAPTATVHYGLSYFSPVACNEEVQLDGRVVGRKGKLTAAVVEVRKMGSGELVAIGRQWMTPAWPTKSNKSVETDPRNPQILGGPVPHEWQDKIGGIPECSHNLLPTTAADLEWLTMKKIAKDGVAEHWSKLKISEDDATTAPSFKFRRSCEMVVI